MEDKFYCLFEDEKIPEATAYWINPAGMILPVDTHHIDKIMKNPENFGLSKEDVAVFKKADKDDDFIYSRKEVDRDKADQLILSLVHQGWIRLRRYVKREGGMWTANIPRLNKATKNHLYRWAKHMVDNASSKDVIYDTVNIDAPNQKLSVSIKDIANDYLYTMEDVEEKSKTKLDKYLERVFEESK